MYLKLTNHGRCCMLNKDFPTIRHVELEDNSRTANYDVISVTDCLNIRALHLEIVINLIICFLGLLWCRKEKPLVKGVVVDLQGIDQGLAAKIGHTVRSEKGYESLPIVALTCPTQDNNEKLLQEAGYSSTMLKPLRHTTVATILLQAFGVQIKKTIRKPNANPQLLTGKRLLVVCFKYCHLF